MFKKKGLSFIEVIIGMALIGVMFSLVIPIFAWYGKSEERIRNKNEVDEKLERVDELIRDKIELVREKEDEWSSRVGVYITTDSSIKDKESLISGSVLYLEMNEGDTSSITFSFEEAEIRYQKGSNGVEVLLEDVLEAEFRYFETEKILTYFIRVGEKEEEELGRMGGIAIVE